MIHTMFATDAVVLSILREDVLDVLTFEETARRAGLSARGLIASMSRLAARTPVPDCNLVIIADRWVQR